MKRLCKFCGWNSIDEDLINKQGDLMYPWFPFCSEKHKKEYEKNR